MTAKTASKRGRPKSTSSQRIYEILRKRILRLELAPGLDIDEFALVEEFAVSRTPVREALIRLETDDLVRILPNRGARVSPLDFMEIPELLEAMELCMRVTSRWAAARHWDTNIEFMRTHCETWSKCARKRDFIGMSEANNRFHRAIAEASRNRHLIKMYRGMEPAFFRMSLALLSRAASQEDNYMQYYNRVENEHSHITDLIAAGDVDGVDAATIQHAALIRERTALFIQTRLRPVPLDTVGAQPLIED